MGPASTLAEPPTSQSSSHSPRRRAKKPHFWSRRLSILLLVFAYVPLAVTFSVLTPAYEGDDEGAHTQYVEYIMRNDAIPRIGTASSEAQQPPLYYALAAGWQSLLRIPAFTPQFPLARHIGPNQWIIDHTYTPTERREAIYLHELRILSILLGLGTVLLSYAAATILRLREPVALACGLFVALLPRELVISSNVTNDALATPLCALALVLFLLSERDRDERRTTKRRVVLGCMGLTLGAAAATKFTTLPIAAVLMILAALPSFTLRSSSGVRGIRSFPFALDVSRMLDSSIMVLGFLATSGWWFVRNKILYGQFLAEKSSENDLGIFAHPVPWSLHLFFVQLPTVLWNSTWYAQLLHGLPTWMNDVLAVLAVLALVAGSWTILSRSVADRRLGIALLGCVAGGIVTEVFHIKTTSIGDSRLAFVSLAAAALLLGLGSFRLSSVVHVNLRPVVLFLWPLLFLGLDFFVLVRFLIPHGGL
jgi:hypothetical protein